jgi:hypothetical protein
MKRKRKSAWDLHYELEDLKQTVLDAKPLVFSECVIGYRIWSIDAFGRLRPQAVNQRPWKPGINEAWCDVDASRMGLRFQSPPTPSEPHLAPAADCSCGFYARFSLADVSTDALVMDIHKTSNPWVAGAIAAWGSVHVHHDGFRAEKACVIALSTSVEMPVMQRDLIEWTAESYRVACVDDLDLEREASLHGTPLPKDVRPAKPKDLGNYNDLLAQQYARVKSLQIQSQALSAQSKSYRAKGGKYYR